MVILSNDAYREAYIANTVPDTGSQWQPRSRNMTNFEWISEQGGELQYTMDPNWSTTVKYQSHSWRIVFEDDILATMFILRWS